MRKTAAIVLSFVAVAVLCVGLMAVPVRASATDKEKKEEKTEKSGKTQKGDLVKGINRVYDSFKKGTEPLRKASDNVDKSIKDAWKKLK